MRFLKQFFGQYTQHMKYLLADVYKIIYNVIKNKQVATFLGVLYITILSFICLHGLCVLMEDMVPDAVLNILFLFPKAIGFFIAIFLFLWWWMPTQIEMARQKARKVRYGMILIFTVTAIVSFLYVTYNSRIVF